MRWRLVLEEFGPELVYLKGDHNIVADAFSRMEMDDNKNSRTADFAAAILAWKGIPNLAATVLKSKIEGFCIKIKYPLLIKKVNQQILS